MSSMELLPHFFDVKSCKLTKEEIQFIETDLFIRVCDELKELFKSRYREYFDLMKFNTEMEGKMMEANFFRCIINDILATEDYSLAGIAYYTHSSEEVIYDVVIGLNINPSVLLARKIVDLHRSIRPELYRSIFSKITAEFSKLSL